jgi:hypothetical protein
MADRCPRRCEMERGGFVRIVRGRQTGARSCRRMLGENQLMARRSRGTGSLSIRKDARGIASWYGQWWAGGRRVKRKLGRKRDAGSRAGLTRSQAERELQRHIDRDSATPAYREITVSEAGERLLEHLTSLGRKRSTLGDYQGLQDHSDLRRLPAERAGGRTGRARLRPRCLTRCQTERKWG